MNKGIYSLFDKDKWLLKKLHSFSEPTLQTLLSGRLIEEVPAYTTVVNRTFHQKFCLFYKSFVNRLQTEVVQHTWNSNSLQYSFNLLVLIHICRTFGITHPR